MKTCISAETRASFPLAFASFPLAFALFLLAFAGFPAAANAPTAELQSPIGLWKTVDDKTGKPRALVRIYLQDGKYFGRIEQSFTPGAETRVCSVCTDERRNQPIIGLLDHTQRGIAGRRIRRRRHPRSRQRLGVPLQVSFGAWRDGAGGARLHRHFIAGPIADLAAAKLIFPGTAVQTLASDIHNPNQ